MPILRNQIKKFLAKLKSAKIPFFTADYFVDEIVNQGWSVGRFSYGAPSVVASDTSKLQIGSYC
jgi:hypothetical protein